MSKDTRWERSIETFSDEQLLFMLKHELAVIEVMRELHEENVKLKNREWVGLTDEEIDYIWGITKPDYEDLFDFPRAIEAKLREKNGF